MAHAETTSGAVSLLGRDTAPSRNEQSRLPVPTAGSFRRVSDTAIEDTVSPPRDERTTDVTKVSMTLPMVAAIVVTALTVSGAQYLAQSGQRAAQAQMASDIRDIRTRLDAQKENIDLKFENLRLEMNNGELRKALLERMNPNGRTP